MLEYWVSGIIITPVLQYSITPMSQVRIYGSAKIKIGI